MDEHLQELIRKEDERLEVFCKAAVVATNLGFKHLVVSINRVAYKHYTDVLEIVYMSGKRVYININANSVQATARELLRYISTQEAQGLIEVIY